MADRMGINQYLSLRAPALHLLRKASIERAIVAVGEPVELENSRHSEDAVFLRVDHIEVRPDIDEATGTLIVVGRGPGLTPALPAIPTAVVTAPAAETSRTTLLVESATKSEPDGPMAIALGLLQRGRRTGPVCVALSLNRASERRHGPIRRHLADRIPTRSSPRIARSAQALSGHPTAARLLVPHPGARWWLGEIGARAFDRR